MDPSTESLNYSAAALSSTFGYYRSHYSEANQDGRTSAQAANQEVIANKVYAERIGNGNIASGDGWRYRGRGMKQVTGKGNYKKFSDQYKTYWATDVQSFSNNPDLLVQMPYAIRSAVWFWVSNGCMKKADRGMRNTDVDEVTGIVNHGELGTPKAIERRNFAQNAYSILE
jgi:putative chitinase